ncbi:MAG: PD40 domain-containing protein [Bacteroidetes bacterium]|nr:PD40 domain-containing protein [Bacteroidota bacterium]
MKHYTRITLLLCLAMFLAPALRAQDEKPLRPVIIPDSYDISIRSVSPLNSSDNDFAPMLLGNGRIMYFTSDREGDQNIYTAMQGGGNWEQVQEAGPELNTSGDEGGTTVTPDGHWMVFTGCDRDDSFGDCDLYIAEYVDGSWRNVKNLGPNVNSPAWDSQPTISPDGLMLFFVSERPGGLGGTDLWMTKRSFGGDWSPAVNLGRTVNTTGDEFAPHIAADNATLYFSSDMHPGIGGQDVYRSKRAGSGWSSPQHLGTPVNSEYDDYFCSLKLNSEDMYFSSNRGSSGGDLDVFLAIPNPLPPGAVTTVIGSVTDSQNGTPIEATLTVRDIQSNEILSSFRSDANDGSYVVVLQPGRTYVITAEAPEYLFYSDRFDVPADSKNNSVRKDVKMTRDLVRLLVYFDFDKATLQPTSAVDLDRAVEWLKANPSVKVELAGHTDNVGAKDYNKKLSRERAQSVLDYLVSKGVAPQRLAAQGFGMEQPITTNDTEEGRAMNRRVEFRVVSR